MDLHNVVPGSTEWLALRAQPNTFTASEAPAMMGVSPYMTRSELLHQKHTGLTPDVDTSKQRLFDAGHEAEAAYRPIAEDIIGDELYPCTGSIEHEGMRLLASFDGLTMNHKTGFEHKLYNGKIADAIDENGEPGPAYYWQLEHQLLVSGAERIKFVTSNGTKDRAKWCWYVSKPERRAALIAGWKQFAEDLKAYTPPAPSAVEKIVAEPVEALPAPMVKVTGQIALVDNFKVFENSLRQFLADKLIREPKTDEDFVNLDSQIKAMKAAREALKAAEAQMLAQVEPIDIAKKSKDALDKLLQQNVKLAEDLLTAEKDRRKGEIVAVGVKGLADHIITLNQRLGKPYMPAIPADFGGAIKGLKSLASMEDKVSTELARAKIAANQVADQIQINLTWLRENATDYAALFPDEFSLVLKAPDDFKATAENRVSNHKTAKQAEADRIRKEAEEKARADLLAEQAAKQPAPVAADGLPVPIPYLHAPSPSEPQQLSMVEPAPDNGARLKLGELNARLAPLSISADGLAELGFPHVATEKAAKLYRASDWQAICDALVKHLTEAGERHAA